MARQLTIRGVSDDLSRRLTRLSHDRGQSLNATALQILEDALGVKERRQRLARYATWSEADLKEFEGALAGQRVIDDALWD
jgi:plasmid stability protein